MTSRIGDFDKQVRNARNSNDNFAVKVEDEPAFVSKNRRTSAALLQKAIIRGDGTKKNFTTITPQGLPADLIGTNEQAVERQNLLNEPRGHKNEAARLPPFKPFKTISDEDNIHLLPGETGERVRLNLLDTKLAGKKDVEDVKKAYYSQRALYPELYNKQKIPIEPLPPPPPEPPKDKKTGFFKKLFGKKEKDKVPEPPKSLPPPVIPPPVKPPPSEPPKPAESIKTEKPKSKPSKSTSKKSSESTSSSGSSSESSSGSESSSSESSSSDEEMQQWGGYPYGGYPMMGGYPPQYPGFPGGFAPYFNQPYCSGFGPVQLPPCYNPCMEEIQLTRCQELLKKKKDKGGRGDEIEECRKMPRIKKPQGLNFDFLPHDDLATEVTMTIEPDEPEPLQYAVENGIMPIICCYMPSSLAVQPQQAAQEASSSQFYNSSGYGYGYGNSSNRTGKSLSNTPTSTKTKTRSSLSTHEDETSFRNSGVDDEDLSSDLNKDTISDH